MTTSDHQYVDLTEEDFSLLRESIDDDDEENNITDLKINDLGGTTSTITHNDNCTNEYTSLADLRKLKTARTETHQRSLLMKIAWKSEYFKSIPGPYIHRIAGFDSTQNLRVTAFDESAKVLFDSVKLHGIYEFKNLLIKKAHPWYNSMTQPLEATFDLSVSAPLMEYLGDRTKFPDQMTYNLTKLGDISAKYSQIGKVQCCLELMGVCIRAGPITRGKYTTRFITMIDDTNVKIDILLWGNDCDKFELTDYPVLVIWGVQVRRTFKGQLYLNVQRCHDFIHEPDFTAANEFRDWWFTTGILNLDNFTYADLISKHPLTKYNEAMEYYLSHQPVTRKAVADQYGIHPGHFSNYLIAHKHRQQLQTPRNPIGNLEQAKTYKQQNHADKTNTLEKHLNQIKVETGKTFSLLAIKKTMSKKGMTKKQNQRPKNASLVQKVMSDYLKEKKKNPNHTVEKAVEDKDVSADAVRIMLGRSGLGKKRSRQNQNPNVVSEAVNYYLKHDGRYTYKDVTMTFNKKYHLTEKSSITADAIRRAKAVRQKRKE